MLLLIAVLLIVGATGAAVQQALQPPLELFLVPGAVDIQVVSLAPHTRLITYRAPGQPCDWHASITQTLAARGWQQWTQTGHPASDSYHPLEMRSDLPRRTYTHTVAFPLGYLWDQAVLDPDPDAKWSEGRAPIHCHSPHADPAPDHQSGPHVARIVVRRTLLPSYWLVEQKHRLLRWLRRE
jgi:hypothetical protein